MIAQLSELSKSASPTAFHNLLRVLDDRGRLLRVYTQNIDALESKTGLTFGVPELDGGKPVKPRSTKGKGVNPGLETHVNTTDAALELQKKLVLAVSDPVSDSSALSIPSTSRLPSPPLETPRCIPLHGTLQSMHCQLCLHSFPLSPYLVSLASGSPPLCPECTTVEITRQAVGKRSRGIGKLRPSVVLYNEMHKDGEEVGEVVRKDLVGLGSKGKGKTRAGADLLLVVGTSLRVPGTKRIVREFSKAVRSRDTTPSTSGSASESSSKASKSSSTGLVTPAPSPRRTPSVDDDTPVRTIYLNLDFPVPTREWEGVFDVWVRGDAQSFAKLVQEEIETQEREKVLAEQKKREAAETRRVMKEEKERKKAALLEIENSKSQAKGKGKKGKVDVKGKGKAKEVKKVKTVSANSKKRKAVTGDTPTKPNKRPKTLAPVKHTKTGVPTRLTIVVPARARNHYRTPPNSQGTRRVPEVVITTTPRRSMPSHHSSSQPQSYAYPPSSPLTPIPSSASSSSLSRRSSSSSGTGYISPPNSQRKSQAGLSSPHRDSTFEYFDGSELTEPDQDSDMSGEEEMEEKEVEENITPRDDPSPSGVRTFSPMTITPPISDSEMFTDEVLPPYGLRSPFPTSGIR